MDKKQIFAALTLLWTILLFAVYILNYYQLYKGGL